MFNWSNFHPYPLESQESEPGRDRASKTKISLSLPPIRLSFPLSPSTISLPLLPDHKSIIILSWGDEDAIVFLVISLYYLRLSAFICGFKRDKKEGDKVIR
jgi:hypothetical protein